MLLAFTGYKQSGKDTSAEYLKSKYGFASLNFSEPLKSACKCLFNFTDEQLNGDKKESPDPNWYGVTPRRVMQFVSTELLRNKLSEIIPEIGEDIFVKILENKLDINKNIVVTDLRFTNEYSMLKKHNAIVVKIIRDSPHSDTHISECGNIPYDYIIYNISTLDALYTQIDNIIIDIQKNK